MGPAQEGNFFVNKREVDGRFDENTIEMDEYRAQREDDGTIAYHPLLIPGAWSFVLNQNAP